MVSVERWRHLTHAAAFTQKPAPTLQRAPVFLMLARLADEQGDQYDDGQWNAQQQQEDGTHGRLLDLYDR
jgi:hypothetical protein